MAAQFIKMEKNGVEILITPEKVEAHKAAGWKVVAAVTVAEEPKPEEPVKKAPAKSK